MIDPLTWQPRKTIVHDREMGWGNIAKKSRIGRFCSTHDCCFCGRSPVFALKWSPKGHPGQIHHDTFTAEGWLMTIDHIIPDSWGGMKVSQNLRPACCKCNSKRNINVTIEELESLRDKLPYIIGDWDLFTLKVNKAHPDFLVQLLTI